MNALVISPLKIRW